MKKLINNLVNNKDYRVVIMNNKIHIVNYKSIIDINESEAFIKFVDRIVKICGKNFTLIKLDKSELLIKGNIKRIELNE